jgi:hypothetical protein
VLGLLEWSYAVARPRAIWPSRGAIGALIVVAPVAFGVRCWTAAGELLSLAYAAMALMGRSTSFAFVHLAAFLFERQIRSRLTVSCDTPALFRSSSSSVDLNPAGLRAKTPRGE